MRRASLFVAAAGAVALALTGCSGVLGAATSKSGSDSAASQNVADLLKQPFAVQAFEGASGDVKLVGPVEITFGQDEWGVSTPCNSHGGAGVTLTDTRVEVTENYSTAVGCSDALTRQGAFISEFFGASPSWELSDDRLTLRAGGAAIVAVPLKTDSSAQ
mgnify:FL=1